MGARYDAELLPIMSIVRHPGRPVILGTELHIANHIAKPTPDDCVSSDHSEPVKKPTDHDDVHSWIPLLQMFGRDIATSRGHMKCNRNVTEVMLHNSKPFKNMGFPETHSISVTFVLHLCYNLCGAQFFGMFLVFVDGASGSMLSLPIIYLSVVINAHGMFRM